MRVSTSADLGAYIRDRRKQRRLSQTALAELAGVSPRWLVEVEKGKASAELGKVLSVLASLGVSIEVRPGEGPELVDAEDRGVGPAVSGSVDPRVAALLRSPGIDLDDYLTSFDR